MVPFVPSIFVLAKNLLCTMHVSRCCIYFLISRGLGRLGIFYLSLYVAFDHSRRPAPFGINSTSMYDHPKDG